MKLFVVMGQYEGAEPWLLGIYLTQELAEKAIVDDQEESRRLGHTISAMYKTEEAVLEINTAYLLLACEEHADPKYHGITTDKAVAETWRDKQPVSFDTEHWNSYVPLPIV